MLMMIYTHGQIIALMVPFTQREYHDYCAQLLFVKNELIILMYCVYTPLISSFLSRLVFARDIVKRSLNNY